MGVVIVLIFTALAAIGCICIYNTCSKIDTPFSRAIEMPSVGLYLMILIVVFNLAIK